MLYAEIIGLVQLWPGRGLDFGEQLTGLGLGLSLGLEGWALDLALEPVALLTSLAFIACQQA